VPRGFWNSIDNQRLFFDHLARKYNVTHPEQWHFISSTAAPFIVVAQRCTAALVKRNGGMNILKRYKGSLAKALKAIYPEYPIWKLGKVSSGT
jgi:hypothetical protein